MGLGQRRRQQQRQRQQLQAAKGKQWLPVVMSYDCNRMRHRQAASQQVGAIWHKSPTDAHKSKEKLSAKSAARKWTNITIRFPAAFPSV